MTALRRLTVANLKSFLRDRAALFWTVAFPLIFVVIFGLIFSGGPTPASYGFVDLDGSPASGTVKQAFASIDGVTLVKGSQEYTRLHMRDGRELVIDACDKRCPSRYDLEIDIVTPDISGVAIDGGGEIEAQSGFPAQDSISVAVNGGGDIDLHAIKAAAAHAAVNGGGKIELTAEHQLNAAVAGGGEIVYHGNPQVNEAVQGGGSVERAGG